MARAFVVTLALFAAILAVAGVRYAPPAPLGRDAPATEFSAERARDVSLAISGEGTPRPVGSEANAKVRAYLDRELRRLGFDTEIQRGTSCTKHAQCGRVENIVASRVGRDPTKRAVLLMVHYDSVPCSPGAGDDGFGTAAALEIARAISVAPQLERTVVIVLTDGEEAGLLGADVFVREHPLAKQVSGVVNIDSRGSRGPSQMFETSAGNRYVLALFAAASERPVTTSLYYEIYKRMPNDTDFTFVKALGHGVNLANIGGVEHYHTPLDSYANADPGTLQHHGAQALAMVRALAGAGATLDAPHDTSDNAVWFDVLAFFVVKWRAKMTAFLAFASFALLLVWAARKRALGWRLVAAFAALVAALASSVVVGVLLRAVGAIPVPWVAHPSASLVALHGASLLGGLSVGRLVAHRSGTDAEASANALFAGTWLMWAAFGFAVSLVAPGASYLFVMPTLIASVAAWLRIDVAASIGAVAAAFVWMPLVVLMYDGLGFLLPPLASLASTLLVTTLVAFFGRTALGDTNMGTRATRVFRLSALGALGVVGVAVGAAAIVPRFSEAVPQRVNVVFRQDSPEPGASPVARTFLEAAWGPRSWGAPPESMRRVLGDGDASAVKLEAPAPWSTAVLSKAVPAIAELATVAPDARAVEQTASPIAGSRKVRVRVRSRRGSDTMALTFPESRHVDVFVDGQRAMPRAGAVRLRGVPAEGVDVTFEITGADPLDVTFFDFAYGLPPATDAPLARALVDARPKAAAQTQDGDVTLLANRFRL